MRCVCKYGVTCSFAAVLSPDMYTCSEKTLHMYEGGRGNLGPRESLNSEVSNISRSRFVRERGRAMSNTPHHGSCGLWMKTESDVLGLDGLDDQ